MPQLSAHVHIDRTSPVPLYFQVAGQMAEAIRSGRLPRGTRLANELALAGELGLSRPTMRQALQHLADQGLVVRRRGIGTLVVAAPVRRQVALTSLYDDLEHTGRHPRTDVLSFERATAAEYVAAQLGLPAGTEVLSIQRLRFAGDEPLAVLQNYLPGRLAGVTAAALRGGGLYQLLRQAGVNPRSAQQTIGARRATPSEAQLLDELTGATLLTMTRTAFDDTGRAVEFGTHVFRASRYAFDLTVGGT
jgi:DNA-binding GntR family transcriptional regulator